MSFIYDIIFWLIAYVILGEVNSPVYPKFGWKVLGLSCLFESTWIFSNLSDGGEAKLHPEEPELFDWRLAPVWYVLHDGRFLP